MQLIAIATYPNLDGPVVDLVYRVASGLYRLHEMVSRAMPADEGEEIGELEVIKWAATAGPNVVMVGNRASAAE